MSEKRLCILCNEVHDRSDVRPIETRNGLTVFWCESCDPETDDEKEEESTRDRYARKYGQVSHSAD